MNKKSSSCNISMLLCLGQFSEFGGFADTIAALTSAPFYLIYQFLCHDHNRDNDYGKHD